MSDEAHIPDEKAARPPDDILQSLLAETAERHAHLCPRQVLGVRMGLFGLRWLGKLDGSYHPSRGGGKTAAVHFSNKNKKLLTMVETDGCGADGIAVATDCSVGRRTLRVIDYGKMAAVFVDVTSERAVRVVPRSGVRDVVWEYAPDAANRWHAYRAAYQVMPDEALLSVCPVRLQQPVSEIISRAGARAMCEACGEEIMNERELLVDGRMLCVACARGAYYRPC